MDRELAKLLSDADRALGRLDGAAYTLPNVDLFVGMYVRHEAVLSSQIEGTQSTLEDFLEFEMTSTPGPAGRYDVEEVVHYVAAMNHGLDRLDTLPVSARLLRELHAVLLRGGRGSEKRPGEFRNTQNWIGSRDTPLSQAEFVPPPPGDLAGAIGDFEMFLHDRSLPDLIHCALAHAQFETIHPFLDGNGRVGRLLITLLLCERGILRRPLLYLSYFLKAHRAQYYDRLTAVRNEGDWEGWIKFFLRGVFEVSQAATEVSRKIVELQKEHRELLSSSQSNPANALRLLDRLFLNPYIRVRDAQDQLECSYATASAVVRKLERLGIIREVTGRTRNRLYRYEKYYALFQEQSLTIRTGTRDGQQR